MIYRYFAYPLAIFLLLALSNVVNGQTTKDYAVLLSAKVNKSPFPTITLSWDKHASQTAVYLFRKSKTDVMFPTNPLITLDSVTTTWTDSNVIVGNSYEYRVVRDILKEVGKDTTTGNPILRQLWGFGYAWCGIEAVPVRRGTVLLVIDNTMVETLSNEIAIYKSDLEADGFTVLTTEVERAEKFDGMLVNNLRQYIKDQRTQTKGDLSTVVLIGRVAVPYSGNIAPDGHTDHIGAWPADGIYGDVNGMYTDASVTRVNNSRPSNDNKPLDGKFDQSLFSSTVSIAVGRIDMYDLDAFEESETELLKMYFQKNHAFRMAEYPIKMGGIIDDNFGGYGDRFAASGWRSYSVFESDTSVRAGDFITGLKGPETYLWAYGCGGGTDTSAGGVARTSQLAANPIYAVFTSIFGSYHGDYDTKNNLMRASLASAPRVLSCSWSGRPHWYMHHMGLGETIGYSTLISQNNSSVVNGQIGTYVPNVTFNESSPSLVAIGDRGVHIALLGDPTLRAVMSPISPVKTISATYEFPNKIKVQWESPSADVSAYLVYRKRANQASYTLLTSSPTSSNDYLDSLVYQGDVAYRVVSCQLRKTGSGSYYDVGSGKEVSVLSTDIADEHQQGSGAIDVIVSPNPIVQSANISITVPTHGLLVAALTSVGGSVVWQTEIPNCLAGTHAIGIDLEHGSQPIAAGRYILTVKIGSSVSNSLVSVLR